MKQKQQDCFGAEENKTKNNNWIPQVLGSEGTSEEGNWILQVLGSEGTSEEGWGQGWGRMGWKLITGEAERPVDVVEMAGGCGGHNRWMWWT